VGIPKRLFLSCFSTCNLLCQSVTEHIVFLWLISNLMHKILIYLHIIHLLKSFTCFAHYPAHLQEVYVIVVYMQPLVLSLSAGDCPVHRLRKKVRRRPSEDEQGNARNMYRILINV
jgi:hypothetical protein